MKIYISGFGSVSRSIIKLLANKQDDYQMNIRVVGIIGRHGLLEDQSGLNLQQLLESEPGSAGINAYAKRAEITLQTDYTFRGDVLVEAAPTHQAHGEPGYSYMKQAITDGLDIVAISKGALVHHFLELMELAQSHQRVIKYSGAVAAALPTLDVAEYCLAGTTITEFAAVLNGTSNYILSEMMDTGRDFSESLQRAQEKGIAETDPSLDVEGIDTANKLVILANSIFKANRSYNDASVIGITNLTKADILHAKEKGSKVRLVARATCQDQIVTLSVKTEFLSNEHPLSHVHGTNKGILFSTEEMGELFVSGGASSPTGAGSAAIKDLINLTKLERSFS